MPELTWTPVHRSEVKTTTLRDFKILRQADASMLFHITSTCPGYTTDTIVLTEKETYMCNMGNPHHRTPVHTSVLEFQRDPTNNKILTFPLDPSVQFRLEENQVYSVSGSVRIIKVHLMTAGTTAACSTIEGTYLFGIQKHQSTYTLVQTVLPQGAQYKYLLQQLLVKNVLS
jgi:hypothetical protein